MFEHMDPRWVDHPGWWGSFGWVVPLVVFLAIVGLVIWAVLRFTSQPHTMPGTPPPPPPPSQADRALEEVRFQYARGQITREEYLQRTHDLGGGPPGEAPPAGGA